MSNVILVDWSQMVIASATAFGSDFDKGKDAKNQINILRHTILNTILGDKNKFGRESEIVIACDGRDYWRRQIFPHYKQHRKKNREESKTDWKAIFSIGSQLQQEFKEVFPFKFIIDPEVEGDDSIAVLSKWWQDNELVTEGMFEDSPRKIVIKSNDGDFGQLHKYKNVRQWNPLLKKWVTKTSKHDLLLKCIQGDGGDGIPNIYMADDFFLKEEGGAVRQKPITSKIKDHAIKQFDNGEKIYFGDKTMDYGFHRNRNLIDFDYIPERITEKVIGIYKEQQIINDKKKIFNYFVANRCRNLMEKISDF